MSLDPAGAGAGGGPARHGMLEIHGVHFENAGIQFLAEAIVYHLQDRYDLVLSTGVAPFHDRARLGTYQLLRDNALPQWVRPALRLVPPRARQAFGIVTDDQITGILDSSGYHYTGAAWGPMRIAALADKARRWRRRRLRVVLMPQGFGPFPGRKQREDMRVALDHVDLVFARDRFSLDEIRGVAGPAAARIELAPDFTNLVPGTTDGDPEIEALAGCTSVVPNVRMLDEGSPSNRDCYIAFMTGILRTLSSEGLKPVLVLHERNDDALATRLVLESGVSVPIVANRPARVLKAILGRSRAVIASRFHAIVGALSQGVPTIGTGWSHKYPALFQEYDCGECLMEDLADPDVMRRVMPVVTDDALRRSLREKLLLASARHAERTRAMWRLVEDTLSGPRDGAR